MKEDFKESTNIEWREENPTTANNGFGAKQISEAAMKAFRKYPVVPQPNGCWHWTGPNASRGYHFVYTTKNKKQDSYLAHRVAYAIYHGQIPDGYLVCHACDNRGCVNPRHLFAGTNNDNQADRSRKYDHMALRPPRTNKKVDADMVRKIRARLTEIGNLSQVAREFGVSPTQVGNIKHGRTWKHVD